MTGLIRSLMVVVFAAGLVYAAPARGQTDESSEPVQPDHRFGVRFEPSLGVPLSAPQSDRFKLGGGDTVKGFFNLTPWLDIGAGIGFAEFPATERAERGGTAWTFGAGPRLKGPVTANSDSFAMFPWVDADALFVRTGSLSRAGMSAGAGLHFPLGPRRALRAGPFVRYRQIFQGTQPNVDVRDARFLHFGISLELGGAVVKDEPAPAPEAEKECPECPEPKEKVVEKEMPDADGDGFPDKFDRCPDNPGPTANWGCPKVEKVAVKGGKLELKDPVFFAFDRADIQDGSHDVLDQAALMLKKHRSQPGQKIRVQGHADSIGDYDYNQKLSERRAQAVVDYLVERGVERDRFIVEGYSESKPVDSNETPEGRTKNRRVEFDIDLDIVDQERSDQ